METQSKKDFIINVFYLFIIGLIFYILLKYLFFYLLPFIIASVIALLVRKPAIILSHKLKIKRSIISPVLACLFYIFVLAIILFVFYLVISSLTKSMTSITDFTSKFTDIFLNFKNSINNSLNKIFPKLSNEINTFINNAFSNLISKLTEIISQGLSSLAQKIPTYFLNFLVTLVATCFLAKDLKGLTLFLKSICPERIYKNAVKIKNILFTSVSDIIKGYLLLMLITFIELSVSFLILRIKHPFLLGFIIALIDILPVLGTGAVLIPWAIISILTQNISLGISLAIIYIIITVIRNFLEPKIISGNVGINPLFTLAAMFLGIKFFGVSGLFILPITLIVIIRYYKEEMEYEKSLNQ